MDFEHSFDWHGFSFAVRGILVIILASFAGYYGWALTFSSPAPQEHSIIASPGAEGAPESPLAFSTTTPWRVIERLTAEEAMPSSGKFVSADLVGMEVSLYQDGALVAKYPILTKGRPGSPYETPSGFYSVLGKSRDHFNRGAQVHLPHAMQFYGNYFIHGWPYHQDGSPVASTFSGGCIRLSTEDAARVYDFADVNTPLFVYGAPRATSTASIAIARLPAPPVSAGAYLVADLDTGDVYLDREATIVRPIASITKLMTALVANETIMFDRELAVPKSNLSHASTTGYGPRESFVVGDLLYPLLMESNNAVADELARYYGTSGFIRWMNSTAKSLDMTSTSYADPSGVSRDNASTPDDLFRLARYIADHKSFIFKITRTPTKTIVAGGGDAFRIENYNVFASAAGFIGGKVGKTAAAGETMLSVFSVPAREGDRRIAIVVLKSSDYGADTEKLARWISDSIKGGGQAACATCALPTHYRKIEP